MVAKDTGANFDHCDKSYEEIGGHPSDGRETEAEDDTFGDEIK